MRSLADVVGREGLFLGPEPGCRIKAAPDAGLEGGMRAT
jgi:hypothetical protein